MWRPPGEKIVGTEDSQVGVLLANRTEISSQRGIHILGPFPIATAQKKFIVVAMDYFTKWIEAEALATITERQIESFV
ncbi:rve domain-containing protein [Gossypium australe]|uniref:Rve domain-containing protein n=1 Tax=Gossypium australe TaxID=47621 RepID=A0A5B6VWH7_9ROSI|nr:rve domain-containing protein [Gossypium australe]